MIASGSKFLGRTCVECKTYMYLKEGNVDAMDRNKDGYPSIKACYQAGTEPRRRPLEVIPPCHECPKVHGAPEKHWRYAEEITEQSLKAIQYHDECEAVGDWPIGADGRVDPIVRRNAAIIKRVREEIRRKDNVAAFGSIFNMFGAANK